MFPHTHGIGMLEGIRGLGPRPVHLRHAHAGRGLSGRELDRGCLLAVLVAIDHGQRHLAMRRIARRRGVEELEGAQVRDVNPPTDAPLLLRGRQIVASPLVSLVTIWISSSLLPGTLGVPSGLTKPASFISLAFM